MKQIYHPNFGLISSRLHWTHGLSVYEVEKIEGQAILIHF